MILKETNEKTVRREVFEFEKEFGKKWETDTWTRLTVNGDLKKWIPHDEYGEMASPTRATRNTKADLEEKYQTEYA